MPRKIKPWRPEMGRVSSFCPQTMGPLERTMTDQVQQGLWVQKEEEEITQGHKGRDVTDRRADACRCGNR
ncbi:hypothetical protein EYF80_012643 [Liparis tanakae]|uniref:Uncharacterized protein n=1 Tax=Liparis tanakae TaxID=230148 RepID=A0A4Z2IIA5_9TELE|nr:hypothetical protein EYF80_012643 [Liparis tanakae]